MIGIIIATHGTLAHSLLETTEMFCGTQKGVRSIGLSGDEAGAEFHKRIELSISDLESEGCKEIVILLDLLGGTPYNQAVQLLNERNFHIIVGANLPMVIATMMYDRNSDDVDGLIKDAINSAKEGILCLDELLNN